MWPVRSCYVSSVCDWRLYCPSCVSIGSVSQRPCTGWREWMQRGMDWSAGVSRHRLKGWNRCSEPGNGSVSPRHPFPPSLFSVITLSHSDVHKLHREYDISFKISCVTFTWTDIFIVLRNRVKQELVAFFIVYKPRVRVSTSSSAKAKFSASNLHCWGRDAASPHEMLPEELPSGAKGAGTHLRRQSSPHVMIALRCSFWGIMNYKQLCAHSHNFYTMIIILCSFHATRSGSPLSVRSHGPHTHTVSL